MPDNRFEKRAQDLVIDRIEEKFHYPRFSAIPDPLSKRTGARPYFGSRQAQTRFLKRLEARPQGSAHFAEQCYSAV
jgi:hypothetical protein